MASKEADAAAKKLPLMQKANEKLAVVKATKDDTLDWDSNSQKHQVVLRNFKQKTDAGPSNDNIMALKNK